MIKIIAILAVLTFMLAGCAAAEESAASVGTVIDITGIIVPVMGLAFSFLAAWFAKAVVPTLKKWLDARTTTEQRTLLYEIVRSLVNAAEQVLGAGMGPEKMAYVTAALNERGLEVDTDMIESAVREMNERIIAGAASVMKPLQQPEGDKI